MPLKKGQARSKDLGLISRSDGFRRRKAAGASCIAVTSASRPRLNTRSWHFSDLGRASVFRLRLCGNAVIW
jgi:hypothetical protein